MFCYFFKFMCKLISLLKIKSLLSFALTVCWGFYSAGFFDRYVFSFGIYESFSKAEARNLIGRQVKNGCQPKPSSDITGEISGYTKNDFSDIYVNVSWENNEVERSGKLLPTGFSKGAVRQCLKLVESE